MTRPDPVTVVGNGVAGYACAMRLASRGAAVTMIGPGLPCDRPPLSKRALDRGSIPYMATPAQLSAAGINHLDGLAIALDLGSRKLRFCPTGERSDREIAFGPLVWATGLRVSRPPVPGIDTTDSNADPAGAEAVVAHLATPGRRVVVIGAGLIGCETAATLARRHQVSLIERAEHPLQRMHPCVREGAEHALRRLGVTFAGRCGIERIDPVGTCGHLVRTSTHGDIAADVVLAATGVEATLPDELGGRKTVATDESLAITGVDGVWACGDVAAFPHPRFGRIAIPHWDNARASGAHAANAILGSRMPYVRDPYWFSDIGPLRIQQVGFAPAVCDWTARDGLHIGHDADGRPACIVLLDAPQRLNDARRLVAPA
jgi:3-phenylpropionate/trans-cinnamate dioxygenase ferredoxin reductase component